MRPFSAVRTRRGPVVLAAIGMVAMFVLLITTPAFAAPTSNVLVGTDRMHTAILVSQEMFPGTLPAGSGIVLAPAETYQEALCGAPLASAYGGPVLLTYTVGLNNGVRDEMIRLAPAYVVCIGLPAAVVSQVTAALPTADVSVIRGTGGSVYDMSYKVAKALGAKVGDLSAATAIITIGTNYPDAIGVSPLACHALWPVLLTDDPNGQPLHASAAAAISELGITKALKVGTYVTLPAGVTGVGNLSGADRYYTNRNVALWANGSPGMEFTHLGVTTGENFPDALAAGPYLALDGGILMLTRPSSVPAPISDTIVAHSGDVDQVDFIGLAETGIWLVSGLLPGLPPPLTPTLGVGSSGPAVAWLEARLTSLTYRPGDVDGVFDPITYHGLIGFQKYEGLATDGQVNAADWARLTTAVRPVATQAATGTWIEVDKTRQVLLYVVNGLVTKTLAVSTGSPNVGVETPNGSYTITQKIPGTFSGMYFQCVFTSVPVIGNLSIHGYTSVPTYPASHGCVRTIYRDQNELYPQISVGMQMFVYGVQPPSP